MTTASPTELAPDAVEPQPPASGPTERARRRRERRRARRRQQARVASIVAVSVVLVLGTVTFVRSGRSGDGDDATATIPGGATSRGVPPAVLAQRDAIGAIPAVSVLAPGSGTDGHLILVPPGTMAELPSYGLDAVGKSFQLGGAPLLRAALENLLHEERTFDPPSSLRSQDGVEDPPIVRARVAADESCLLHPVH